MLAEIKIRKFLLRMTNRELQHIENMLQLFDEDNKNSLPEIYSQYLNQKLFFTKQKEKHKQKIEILTAQLN